jgi:hypothetical protein
VVSLDTIDATIEAAEAFAREDWQGRDPDQGPLAFYRTLLFVPHLMAGVRGGLRFP